LVGIAGLGVEWRWRKKNIIGGGEEKRGAAVEVEVERVCVGCSYGWAARVGVASAATPAFFPFPAVYPDW
jgi:hypothetical protein